MILNVDQGNTLNEGRRVRAVGRSAHLGSGVLEGPAHCSYGATIRFDAGYSVYVSTEQLEWETNPDQHYPPREAAT